MISMPFPLTFRSIKKRAMDGPRMDGPTDRLTDGPIDKPTDGLTDGLTDGPMDGLTDRQTLI